MTRKRLDAEQLWHYAVRALAGRAHSTGEMRTKLEARASRPDDVPAILARLLDYGYLDDARFAEMVAGVRLQTQGFGKARVLRELSQRKVAPKLAQAAAARTFSDVSENDLVEQYLERRVLRPGALLEAPKDLASAYRKLRRAGFSTPAILAALKRRTRDPELVDTFEEPEEESGS